MKEIIHKKTCTACNLEKPSCEFYKQPRGKYGVNSVCKKCKIKEMHDRYFNNIDKYRAKNVEFRKKYYQEGKYLERVREYQKTSEKYKESRARYQEIFITPELRKSYIYTFEHLATNKPNYCKLCSRICIPICHRPDVSRLEEVVWICRSCKHLLSKYHKVKESLQEQVDVSHRI